MKAATATPDAPADVPADASVATAARRHVAVVGAGWAGLAAAVEATRRGHQVTLLEMAPQAGGRARSLMHGGDTYDRARRLAAGSDASDGAHGLALAGNDRAAPPRLDNGQHLLIGAYTATLALMRQVGVDPAAVLLRRPLELVDHRGQGLRLPAGPALVAFARGVWGLRHWTLGERLALQTNALAWLLRGFRCAPGLTVAALCARLPTRVRREFIEPLCVAALNTPAEAASAAGLLRVLKDALFSGPGSSDLLIPRRPLAELLPEPATAWLRAQGTVVHLGQRVQALHQVGPGWRLACSGGTVEADAVVLACSAAEAARLAAPHAPHWAQMAGGFGYEPIVTVYLQAPGARLVAPMVALAEGPDAPAQFAFDHGVLGGQPGRFAFVVSGAAPWVARGLDATRDAVMAQARLALQPGERGAATVSSPTAMPPDIACLQVVAEKRATFRCTPGLQRPPAAISAGLVAAGDHVEGPYPATLEGAVRSGLAALDLLGQFTLS